MNVIETKVKAPTSFNFRNEYVPSLSMEDDCIIYIFYILFDIFIYTSSIRRKVSSVFIWNGVSLTFCSSFHTTTFSLRLRWCFFSLQSQVEAIVCLPQGECHF